MQVRDVMTGDPACCTPDTNLTEVARLMRDNDCGEIPIVNDLEQRQLLGVVTDRDIVCRAVAEDRSPDNVRVSEVMTDNLVTVQQSADLQECCEKMEANQIRRVPVLDENGSCCGIVAQADVARFAGEHATAEVVQDISQPNPVRV